MRAKGVVERFDGCYILLTLRITGHERMRHGHPLHWCVGCVGCGGPFKATYTYFDNGREILRLDNMRLHLQCGKEITSANIHAKIGEVDLCEICLKEAYLEYMRLIEKQVPSRRGGFRTLGEYDS